jgi:hypothetical protein
MVDIYTDYCISTHFHIYCMNIYTGNLYRGEFVFSTAFI